MTGLNRALPLVLVLALAASCAADDRPAPAEGGDSRLDPNDLVYRGAFRLPDGPENYGWKWSGQALAYRGDGDPNGRDDGHGGSLFGTGHNWHQWVSEVSIPRPVVSKAKRVEDLPTAKTLQAFADIRGKLYPGEMEQPRAGLAWLEAQGKQSAAKLYFCFGPHADETSTGPAHGWCDVDLSKPSPAGLWRVGNHATYLTTDYLTPIPAAWADTHVGGMRLATGRFRDGGQGSCGPTLIALAPWQSGNPPKPDANLPAKVLLRYAPVTDANGTTLRDYHHSDAWTGASWLTAGDRSAVVFVGTKGKGKCWYGFANGVVWPEEGPWPEVPEYPNDQRGWWSTRFEAEMLFYDPADLAAVAAGKMPPHRPQPYATLSIEEVLYNKRPRRLEKTGAAAFDPRGRFLYVLEPLADGDKSLVHVWEARPR